MALTVGTGRVVRVNGPVVHLAGLGPAARFDLVEVGDARLPGEVVSLEGERAVVQVYEYTGGLRVGEPARATGQPLSAWLGPGLLGGLFDGLLRPLDDAPTFLLPRPLTSGRAGRWPFSPRAKVGAQVQAGDVLGVISGGAVEHRVTVPPGLSGELTSIAAEGDVRADSDVAVIGGVGVPLITTWPVRRPRPFLERIADRVPFVTGQRVLDLLAPIAKGSSATVVGGFGEGKTMLLEQLVKWGDADVIIYVGCGERGNELADLIGELRNLEDPRTGRSVADRTVIIANTSNMPVMAREASIYTAATVAEYFRDMGYATVVIADSTSRWAEALRELSSRTGVIPAEEGYPPELPAALAAFYARSGRVRTLGDRDASVTIVTSVSPPGGDLTEPVTSHTERFVQAVWVLDRDLAYARHYPAVSWRGSSSRDADATADWFAAHGDPEWAVQRARLMSVLAEADRIESVAELVGVSALPAEERMVLLAAHLIRDGVLQQSAMSDNDAHCSPPKQSSLCGVVLAIHEATTDLAANGVPAGVLEEFDFTPFLRAKDDTAPDGAAAVDQIGVEILARLRELRK